MLCSKFFIQSSILGHAKCPTWFNLLMWQICHDDEVAEVEANPLEKPNQVVVGEVAASSSKQNARKKKQHGPVSVIAAVVTNTSPSHGLWHQYPQCYSKS